MIAAHLTQSADVAQICEEGGVILKFKGQTGVVGATVSRSEYPSLNGWIGRCGTIITRVQKTPGRAAGQLRKAMKRAGFVEVQS